MADRSPLQFAELAQALRAIFGEKPFHSRIRPTPVASMWCS